MLKRWVQRELRPGHIDLVVDNGYGGEVVVPPSGTAEVMPLRLGPKSHGRRTLTYRQRKAYVSLLTSSLCGSSCHLNLTQR